jgi:hypothetical protein
MQEKNRYTRCKTQAQINKFSLIYWNPMDITSSALNISNDLDNK